MTRDTFDHFQPRDRGLFGDNEQRESESRVTRSNLCDLTLVFRMERPLAIAVSDPAAGANAPMIWLPKSQCEFEMKSATVVEVSMPSWLAKEKGLV